VLLLVIAALCVAVGCEKTIHEVRLPAAAPLAVAR
jgi:hypothetical protein